MLVFIGDTSPSGSSSGAANCNAAGAALHAELTARRAAWSSAGNQRRSGRGGSLLNAIVQAIVDFVRGSSGPTPAYTRSSRGGDGITSYESLVEEREPIDGWTICTVCLNLDRSSAVKHKRWRCADCGVDTSNGTQRELKDYLTENSAEKIASNLEQWNNVKGVRAAYKMLRSARYKCLLTLGKRLRGEPVGA